jgi:hypothetical protein
MMRTIVESAVRNVNRPNGVKTVAADQLMESVHHLPVANALHNHSGISLRGTAEHCGR